MLKTSLYMCLAATAFTFTSCGDDFQPQPATSGDDGTIELSLMSAPADAGCLRVTATSTRTLTRQFNLTPGQSTVFAMDRLPVGVLSLDAVAFSGACAAVASSALPTWVLEAPVNVQVKPVGITQVLLTLIRNGRISVGVDWEDPPWISTSTAPVDIAVFGDAPYGAVQIADFPQFIADINAASPPVAEIVHLGDIKNGSSRCDTTYFQLVLDNLNLSGKPVLYTPGDNEWTDCHRANNGAYDPLERLATLRSMFFPVPGLSLGASHKQVLSQSSTAGFETFVENQLWFESSVAFTLIHVVGSNNSLLPWFTDDTTGAHMDDPARRTAEVAARVAADIDWLGQTFALARTRNAAAVVVIMQADMWDGSTLDGFNSTVQKLAELTLAFGKPVLLIEGDSHVFKVDNPMAAGDPVHGVTTPVPNLTRIVVQGSTTAPLSEWVRLHIDPSAAPPFSWTRNPR